MFAGGLVLSGCGGSDGDDGTPGVDCWDLNGNFACDPESEDFDGDGDCTVLDCRGETPDVPDGGGGEPGVACWDLNENNSCDAADEDVNGDGECSVADCAAVTSGTLDGTVVNTGGTALEGVAIALTPAVAGVDLTSDASGAFSADLPVGSYILDFSLDGYQDASRVVAIAADTTTTIEMTLEPEAAVEIDTGGPHSGAPGDSVSVTATVSTRDGSSVSSYEWTLVHGPDIGATGTDSDTIDTTLLGLADYRANLIGELPTLQDRLQVVGINHFALHNATISVYEVTVTTDSGETYTEEVEIHAEVPWVVNPGIANVPMNRPVLLHAPTAGSYDWSGSADAGELDATDIQNPTFTPTSSATYSFTIGGETLEVTAGEWAGAVSGLGDDGRVESSSCTGCHDGDGAPDMFTDWRESGHAEIFQMNLNTSTHYGEGCFECHTVGFDPDSDNNGIDEQSDYSDFLAADIINNPSPDNYLTVLTDYPDTGQFTNIQCENCHGPNGGDHFGAPQRISFSSDVCAACHGEPKRHARFQQWEMSGHANYTLAIEEGTSDSCGRCHSGQGFVGWAEEALTTGSFGGSTPTAPATANEVHPQTCVTCHDPHAQGDTSGEPNNATVRVQGNTPVLNAGFAANGVGRGAVCMSCHNSRRGLHNDSAGLNSAYRGPHSPTQTDILMGQNVFFTDVGDRAGHAYLTDSCTTCHMQATDPPEELSYNLGGTNHTFRASMEICSDCHGDFDGEGLQTAFELDMQQLADRIASIAMADLNAAGFEYGDGSTNTTVSAGDVTDVALTEYHGRMALEVSITGVTDPVTIRLGDLWENGAGANFYLTTDTIPRAMWNYFMIHSDHSQGVHNPGFVNRVIVKTNNALDAL